MHTAASIEKMADDLAVSMDKVAGEEDVPFAQRMALVKGIYALSRYVRALSDEQMNTSTVIDTDNIQEPSE